MLGSRFGVCNKDSASGDVQENACVTSQAGRTKKEQVRDTAYS